MSNVDSDLYREIVEATSEAILAIDEQQRIVLVNRGAEGLFGYTAEELRGRPVEVLLPEERPVDDGRPASRPVGPRSEGEPARSRRWVIGRRRSGELFPVEVSLLRHPSSGLWSAFIRDVSSAVRVARMGPTTGERPEAGADSGEDRYRRLYEHIPDIFITVTPEGTIRSINALGARLLGYPRDALLGASIERIIHPDDRAALRSYLAHPHEQVDANDEIELRKRRQDGTTLWVRERACTVPGPGGEPGEVLLMGRDDTSRRITELALQESQAHYRSLFQSAAISLWEEDLTDLCADLEALRETGVDDLRAYLRDHPDYLTQAVARVRVLDLNEATLSLYGARDKSELLGALDQVLSPASLDDFREELVTIFEGGTRLRFETVNRTLQGEEIEVLLHANLIRQAERTRAIISVVDITERRRAEQARAESEAWARLLLDSTGEGIFALDLEGHCTLANPAALELLGYPREQDLLGRDMHSLIHYRLADDAPHPREACRICHALREGHIAHVQDEVFWRSDGTSFPVEYRCHPIRRASRLVGAVVTFADIGERRRAERQLTYLAEHDYLTGLPNRVLFMDRLQSSIARARRGDTQIALLYMDLDGFKPINDNHGHQFGDQLLRSVAQRLAGAVREVDTIARIGGDEFAGILELVSGRATAAGVASKVASAIHQPFIIEAREIHIGISIGIAMYPSDGRDPDALIRSADQAMYQSKMIAEAARQG